ncbi:MAG: cupin domain-containing protein [Chloroflexi bacterium]|nr:cupin domain-containing protein [Chloroflexota bacterium]MQC25975.1 cupin domain-containing protein [Chloroflexota bacterium]
MLAFELDQISSQAAAGDDRYVEFLRVPDLSLGLYRLGAGVHDPQQPHQQDEVYYIQKGRGKIQVQNEIRDVRAGSIIYVQAFAEHQFIEIEEDLEILVFFAPAESR